MLLGWRQSPLGWKQFGRCLDVADAEDATPHSMVCQAGAALKMTDRILWGEICNHQHGGKPTDEARKRQDGYLAVNVARSSGSNRSCLLNC